MTIIIITTIIVVVATIIIMKTIAATKAVLIIKLMAPLRRKSQNKLYSYLEKHGKEIKCFFTNKKTEP